MQTAFYLGSESIAVKPENNGIIANNNTSHTDSVGTNAINESNAKYPEFTKWKGEEANQALKAAWEVSHDQAFILTMTAENGSWDLYKKHPVRNSNGTWDYSMGLNDAYHMPMIKRILAKEVTPKEIMQYHYDIYKKRKGAFYGYYKRNKVKHLIKFP
jgi:hypothetical protein